jgi:hypothetical protein
MRFLVRRPAALRALAAGLCLSIAGAAAVWPAQPAPNTSTAIPDFAAKGKYWVLTNGTQFWKVPGDKGAGPIVDKNTPGVDQGGGGARQQNRIADTNHPLLKPWAKKLMDIANARVQAGGVPFVDASRCWPGGVPSLLLFPGEAVLFVQKPKEVWLIYARDAQVRRIYMNVPHSKNPGYSWKGESVGYYENGDTLVVDTIGLDAKGPLDRYRTPHTRQMHVIERYKLAKDGKGIEITVTVDDPGTFTGPWNAKVDYRPGVPPRSNHWDEQLCADNGDGYGFDPDELVPLPKQTKLEF